VQNNTLEKKFKRFADRTNGIVGSPYWFAFSVLLVLVWLPSGFFLGFNEIWHLLINTTTTILTFLMLSLLHSSQTTWEKKIEKLESREVSTIETIEEETKKLTTTTTAPVEEKHISL
jgi:low affinity Fe/Cu permease